LDAPVRYRGVDIGAVRRIVLAPGDVERVQVTLAIERGTPVKEDTVATLRTQGLTGIGHIELSGGSRTAAPLSVHPPDEYPVILAGPSLMVRMDAAVTALLANLTRGSANFNALLDDANRAELKSLLANLNAVSQTFSARSGDLHAALADASTAMQLAARAAAEVPPLLERTRASAEAVDRMAGEVSIAASAARAAVDGARVEGKQFANETLPQAQALLAELRELTASLKRVSAELERNPAVLVHGRPARRPGPGE
jgi:phospholipid/cholesterol/gamma-HCH transport system substrate-binding protein